MKKVFWGFFIIGVYFVNGCAVNNQIKMIGPLESNTELPPDTGYVVARVINAGDTPLPYNYLTIVPKNLNESEEVKSLRLLSIAQTVGDSSFFVSPVPTGQYSISSIRAFYASNQYWYSRWGQADIELGIFNVEPGKITDLGTIVYYPKPEDDRYKDIVLRSPESSNGEAVSIYTPFLGYQEKDVISWLDDENDAERHSIYVSAVQNPVTHNKTYQNEEGDLYFVGKLGYILVRRSQGDWQTDAIETDSDLNAISESKNGTLAVGGDLGALFVKKKNGEWNSLVTDKSYTVSDLSFIDDVTLDAVLWNKNEIIVKRFSLNSEQSKVMASYSPFKGWKDANGQLLLEKSPPISSKARRRVAYVTAKTLANKNYLLVGVNKSKGDHFSPFDKVSKESFEYSPLDWNISKAESYGKGIDSILKTGKHVLGVKKSWWDGSSIFYRKDEIGDWVKINKKVDRCPSLGEIKLSQRCKLNGEITSRIRSFEFIGTPVFTSPTDVIAFVKYVSHNLNTDPIKKVVISSDGGKSWQESRDKTFPAKYCYDTIPELEDALLVSCNGVSSDFYQSNDEGKTWEHVREHENF